MLCHVVHYRNEPKYFPFAVTGLKEMLLMAALNKKKYI